MSGRNGETYGPVCNVCGPNGRNAPEWTCADCNDRTWPKARGSVCVQCGQDAAADMEPHVRAAQQVRDIAKARETGKREGRRPARQQHEDGLFAGGGEILR